MEFTGAILTGRKSGGGVAGRRHDHYYYPLYFLSWALGGKKEGRKEARGHLLRCSIPGHWGSEQRMGTAVGVGWCPSNTAAYSIHAGAADVDS
jgi:hypothetical protein